MINIYKNKNIITKIFKHNHYIYIFLNSNDNYFITKLHKHIIITKQYFIINTKKSKDLIFLKWFININVSVSKFNFFGRGYKIITKNKKNILIFNKSHINLLFSKNIIIKMNKKNIIYIDLLKNNNVITKLLNIKKFNIYKKIGIKLSKQLLLKKKGKNIS